MISGIICKLFAIPDRQYPLRVNRWLEYVSTILKTYGIGHLDSMTLGEKMQTTFQGIASFINRLYRGVSLSCVSIPRYPPRRRRYCSEKRDLLLFAGYALRRCGLMSPDNHHAVCFPGSLLTGPSPWRLADFAGPVARGTRRRFGSASEHLEPMIPACQVYRAHHD